MPGQLPLSAALDGLIPGWVGAGAGSAPLVGLTAILVGGLLTLAADGDTLFTDAARQALGLTLGGLAALAAARGLAALLGPLITTV